MHFEILVEDSSGKRTLDVLMPKLIGPDDTYLVHPYKGIGRLPKGLQSVGDPEHRILLDQLPRLLRGYGRTFAAYSESYRAAVVVVCDLDDRCQKVFRDELLQLLVSCDPKPTTRFCIAVEEIEAWFLSDPDAVRAAYSRVNESALTAYVVDSICGTWETLANVLYRGGAAKLTREPYYIVGKEKQSWAALITPMMDVEANHSPSFQYFRDTIRLLSRG